MTRGADRDLADELTTRFAAIEGVRAIFPDHAAAAAVLSLVARSADASAGRVRVVADGEAVRISARLATERAVATKDVIALAVVAVVAAVGTQPYELELEFAYID